MFVQSKNRQAEVAPTHHSKDDQSAMLTRCDNCDNCDKEILVAAIGTIKGVAFYFCSPDCRAEYAAFLEERRLVMVIPDATCDEHEAA